MAAFGNDYTTWYHEWRKEKLLKEKYEPPCVRLSKKRELPQPPPAEKKNLESEESKKKETTKKDIELVWVMQPCNQEDPRHNIPVPRRKFIYKYPPPKLDQALQPPDNGPLPRWGKKYATEYCPSVRSTRCEDWSSLREMLPSKGIPIRRIPPNWGTGVAPPPDYTRQKIRYFPIISSPMTRFAEVAHRNDRLFLLH